MYSWPLSYDGFFRRPGHPQAERVFVRIYDLGKTFLTRWPNMPRAYEDVMKMFRMFA